MGDALNCVKHLNVSSTPALDSRSYNCLLRFIRGSEVFILTDSFNFFLSIISG